MKVISNFHTSYAFVNFYKEEDMFDVILELDGSIWDKQVIRVEVSRIGFYKFTWGYADVERLMDSFVIFDGFCRTLDTIFWLRFCKEYNASK